MRGGGEEILIGIGGPNPIVGGKREAVTVIEGAVIEVVIEVAVDVVIEVVIEVVIVIEVTIGMILETVNDEGTVTDLSDVIVKAMIVNIVMVIGIMTDTIHIALLVEGVILILLVPVLVREVV
jgi:hypothetical protein